METITRSVVICGDRESTSPYLKIVGADQMSPPQHSPVSQSGITPNILLIRSVVDGERISRWHRITLLTTLHAVFIYTFSIMDGRMCGNGSETHTLLEWDVRLINMEACGKANM